MKTFCSRLHYKYLKKQVNQSENKIDVLKLSVEKYTFKNVSFSEALKLSF